MEIRYITPSDDRNAISRIYARSWRSAYRGIVPQEYLDSLKDDGWAGNPDIPGWRTMVCVEDGGYIGTSTFCGDRSGRYPGWGEIVSIYLLPEHMGKGLGRMLMESVLAEMRKQGYADVYLWVLEDNLPARGFYENLGFVDSGESMTENIGGKELHVLRYVCRGNA